MAPTPTWTPCSPSHCVWGGHWGHGRGVLPWSAMTLLVSRGPGWESPTEPPGFHHLRVWVCKDKPRELPGGGGGDSAITLSDSAGPPRGLLSYSIFICGLLTPYSQKASRRGERSARGPPPTAPSYPPREGLCLGEMVCPPGAAFLSRPHSRGDKAPEREAGNCGGCGEGGPLELQWRCWWWELKAQPLPGGFPPPPCRAGPGPDPAGAPVGPSVCLGSCQDRLGQWARPRSIPPTSPGGPSAGDGGSVLGRRVWQEPSGPATAPRPCIPVIVVSLWLLLPPGARGNSGQPHSLGPSWCLLTPAALPPQLEVGLPEAPRASAGCLSGPGMRRAQQAGRGRAPTQDTGRYGPGCSQAVA